MKIGIDTTCWINARGYGRFTRELLKAILQNHPEHEYTFITESVSLTKCSFPEGVKIVSVPVKAAASSAASHSGSRSIYDIYKMSTAVSKMKLDIFFFPSVYTYFPVLTKAKKLVTIHDTIPEVYPNLVFNSFRSKLFWKLKTALAVRQANRILTVSEHSRDNIISRFKVDRKRIEVTSEAADAYFEPKPRNGKTGDILKKYDIGAKDRFFLYVGGIAPHKNLRTLINAYEELQKSITTERHKLVIVGDFSADTFLMDESIRSYANINGSKSNNIIFTGYIPDEHLPYFYSNAEACILPSFSEGFGLPALEAMACGTSIIGSNTTSLPEIVGEAGLFFDPHNTQELARCMERIFIEEAFREKLNKLALKRAKCYTWKKAADKVVKIMTRMIA